MAQACGAHEDEELPRDGMDVNGSPEKSPLAFANDLNVAVLVKLRAH